MAMQIVESESSPMQTHYGEFRITTLRFSNGGVHSALVRGKGIVPTVRVQSHCLTSTALQSVMCDCASQVKRSFEILSSCPFGVLIYLDQEARGHGLLAKMRVMRHLSTGMDLREAQISSGHGEDLRTFFEVPLILAHVGIIGEIDLLSESQFKVDQLRSAGVRIRQLLPITEPG